MNWRQAAATTAAGRHLSRTLPWPEETHPHGDGHLPTAQRLPPSSQSCTVLLSSTPTRKYNFIFHANVPTCCFSFRYNHYRPSHHWLLFPLLCLSCLTPTNQFQRQAPDKNPSPSHFFHSQYKRSTFEIFPSCVIFTSWLLCSSRWPKNVLQDDFYHADLMKKAGLPLDS